MNYYKLDYDYDGDDNLLSQRKKYIWAEKSNLCEIVYPQIKKGWFNTLPLMQTDINFWPTVNFYYNSLESNRESDYLCNVNRWPIVHKRVVDVFKKNNIKGVEFYQVFLIDNINNSINYNYYFMYIFNFIDAFDLQKSKYYYSEKYNSYTFIPTLTYFNLKKCYGYDIFRCIKSPAGIYVSDKIKTIIEKNHFTGFFFYNHV